MFLAVELLEFFEFLEIIFHIQCVIVELYNKVKGEDYRLKRRPTHILCDISVPIFIH